MRSGLNLNSFQTAESYKRAADLRVALVVQKRKTVFVLKLCSLSKVRILDDRIHTHTRKR